MAEQDKERKMDDLLDSLLAGYSDVAPRPGLQSRIVAHLRAEDSTTSRGWMVRWLWAAGVVTAAGVALFAIFLLRLPELPQPPSIRAAAPPVLPPTRRETAHPVRAPRTSHKEITPVVAAVRQPVFPTPTPLSDQERFLLQYLAETPKGEVVAQSHEDEPPQPPGPDGPEVRQFSGTESRSTR